jgi:excisionase family DNA binding protein
MAARLSMAVLRGEDRLLTVKEAGELFGTGDRFPRRLIAERRITFVKLGVHVRIPESAVLALLDAGTTEPMVPGTTWGECA